MAEPRAVVDVVGLEARAHELLEQIGLLVRALRRAESRQRLAAAPVEDLLEPRGRACQRLFPGRLAKYFEAVGVGLRAVDVARRAVAAHERLGETLRRRDVVEAEATFDAESILVGVAVAAVDLHDAVVFHGHGRLTADAAERAQRVHHGVELLDCSFRRRLVQQRLLVQRSGRTRLDAFAASHARREPHRVVDVEYGHRVAAAEPHADDVVDLHLAARAYARAARDARVEIHGDGRVRDVELRAAMTLFVTRELRGVTVAARDAHRRRPFPERRLVVGPLFARTHVAREQLEHHAARLGGALGLRRHLHAFRRLADARSREHPLALDLDHAGPAVAVHSIPRQVDVAQVRDLRALALGHVPNRLAWARGDFLAVQLENDLVRHLRNPLETASTGDSPDWAPPGRGRRWRS